jgi:phosphoribosylaminoimidazole-succinocarboxamide synthase
VYDVVLPTPVPDKGRVLTRLSSWWFARLADLVPNHVISTTDVPAEFTGRRCAAAALEMVRWSAWPALPTGIGPGGVRASGSVCGIALPDGLWRPPPAGTDLHAHHQGADRRARRGDHVSPASSTGWAGAAASLRDLTLAIYAAARRSRPRAAS